LLRRSAQKHAVQTENAGIPQEELDNKVAAYKLENSYIGIMGKVLNLLFLL
jgi:hypothetical protein